MTGLFRKKKLKRVIALVIPRGVVGGGGLFPGGVIACVYL